MMQTAVIEPLMQPREEAKRYTAVLILRELAMLSPKLTLQTGIENMLSLLFVTLWDESLDLRVASSDVLDAYLDLLKLPDYSRIRPHILRSLLQQTESVFNTKSVSRIHGSLMAYKNLLENDNDKVIGFAYSF